MPRRSKPKPPPRRWRLPHPPPRFTGRAEERAWLEAALDRGPVTVLAGPAGIGKTALATVVAAERGGVASCLVVSAAARDAAETTTLEVVQALASLGETDPRLDALADFDARVDATLALASAFDGLLLVDGLATHQPEAERWLEELARHADGFKILVTGRASPRNPRAHGQTLVLGPLDQAAARALAAAWAPTQTPEAHLRAARLARGHPGELQRLCRDGSAAQQAPVDALLRLLASAGQPVAFELIEKLAPDIEREDLLASGELRPVGDAFEPWRESLPPPDDADRDRALRTLVLDGSVDATLIAVGMLARTAAAPERLRALLDERGEALLEAGCAARLWAALGELPAAEVESWQLRCAERLGNATVLARTSEPTGHTPEDRLTWARTLFARGKPKEARAFAESLAELAGQEELAHQAACLAADAAAATGDFDGAARVLARAVGAAPDDAPLHLRVHARRWALEVGAPEAARPLGALAREIERAEAPAETWCTLAAAFERRGELDAALEVLDRLERRTPSGPELFASRVAMLIRARVSVERGDPELAVELAEVVAPYSREPSALAPQRAAAELAARWLVGELTGFEARLALLRGRTDGRDAITLARLDTLEAQLSRGLGVPPPERPPGGGGAASVWRARWGQPPGERQSVDRRDAVWLPLAVACDALARSDALVALEAAQRATAEADRWGFAELGLEARTIWAEALAHAGELRALAEVSAELGSRAEACGSRRFALHADLFRTLSGGRMDPATAELLAGQLDVAPTVARWARAASGSATPLDRADASLLASLREQGALSDVRSLGESSEGWCPAWGLDLTERVVWLPDGNRIALGGRAVQWRILEALANAPSLAADKESLVCDAWDEREYHPGRHDGRLYVAIRKLRAAIEDDPSEPTRLLTTETGYALGAPVRIASGAK